MKINRVMLLVVMLVMLGFSSAQAGLWIGAQSGANIPMSGDGHITVFDQTFRTSDVTFAPGYIIGAQVGYDFLCDNPAFPSWLKYLSLAMDYQYNSYNLNHQDVFVNFNGFVQQAGIPNTRGHQNALTWLAIGKYPMLQDQTYPMGRLFPYVGVGPALLWTTVGGGSATNVGLVVEPGIRYMITPHISGDLAYRFRYAEPSFGEINRAAKFSFNSNNSAIMVRLNYHF